MDKWSGRKEWNGRNGMDNTMEWTKKEVDKKLPRL